VNPAKRVLAVDDEPHIRHIVELKLKSAGYEVVGATNGAAALELAKLHEPDLIVTDYQMPGELNGIDLIKAVRETPGIAETPAILLTGSVAVLRRLEEELADAATVTLMSKPFSPRELVKQVKRILDDA
jgi:CheY-like chemotaxis protein